ncbi:hypothetical protein CDAR_87961 [Caerostris darwini]|uniref:Uncharacterized protein n=1 Tax=Caerostris darwini TaxID=1538125 RepID=A0AAV4S3B9_9ARAC|nr:hypothetical protein CDAR_87961 [Caerostris darwini]
MWFVPLLLIFISGVAQGYCYSTTDPIERCNLDLKNLFFPQNQSELREFCGEFKRYYKCNLAHEGYLKSFPCISEVISDNSYRKFCKRFIVIAFEKFKKYSRLSVAFQTISYDVGWLCIIISVSVDFSPTLFCINAVCKIINFSKTLRKTLISISLAARELGNTSTLKP